jgi:hypothetical protein
LHRYVEDFIRALAQVRRSQSGVSGLQALVEEEGPAAAAGDPADDVLVRSLMAEAEGIAETQGVPWRPWQPLRTRAAAAAAAALVRSGG